MRSSSPVFKGAVAVVSAATAFLCTLAADRAASWMLPDRRSVVFPADSRFSLRTSEFAFQAHVNSLGFRGAEPSSEGSALRVLAIGDSATYGWGVGDAEAWPTVLERELRRRGVRVDVANLGRPGAGPDQYARIAEAAVPLLKPDWVIVGLLQGDDLNQSVPPKHDEREGAAPILDALYPTLTEMRETLSSSAKDPLVISADAARAKWRELANDLLGRLKPDQRERFEALPADIVRRYRDGDLNPYVVALAVREPHYYSWLLDESNDVVERKIAAMAEQLERIRRVAESNGARVLGVSVPNWPYVSHLEPSRRLGFDLSGEMLVTTAPDDEMRRACEQAGIEALDVTEALRRHAREAGPMFFPLDGHLNAKGQRLFAETIEPRIAARLAPQDDRMRAARGDDRGDAG